MVFIPTADLKSLVGWGLWVKYSQCVSATVYQTHTGATYFMYVNLCQHLKLADLQMLHTHTHACTLSLTAVLSCTEHTLTSLKAHAEIGRNSLGVGHWGVRGRDIHHYWFINEMERRCRARKQAGMRGKVEEGGLRQMRQIWDEEQLPRQQRRMRRSAYVLLNTQSVRLFTTAGEGGGGGRYWLTHALVGTLARTLKTSRRHNLRWFV